jgi:hypothetical protein
MSASERGSCEGQPSTTAPSAPPWDSPNVVTRAQRPEGVAHGAMVARGFQGEQARGGGSAPAPVDPRRWPAAHELA